MTEITYTLTIGGTNLDCHALQTWRVSAGRDDDVSAPNAGVGTWTLVYDGQEFNTSGLEPGDPLAFDAIIDGQAYPVCRHYLSSLDRVFSWEAPEGRSRVTIRSVGKIQSLNRKLMSYVDPYGNRGTLPGIKPGVTGATKEPLYIWNDGPHYTDGERCWQVVTAAGHTITAPSEGNQIIGDSEGNGQWAADAAVADDEIRAVTRKDPVTIPAADQYVIRLQATAYAGDNRLMVRPKVGTVTGDWVEMNTVTGRDTGEWTLTLAAGTFPVSFEYQGKPPPLTWGDAGGITQTDGQPSVTWADPDNRMTWETHRGLLTINSFTLTDATGAAEWGTVRIAKRDTSKDTPNEPVNRGDYVRQVTACCRSVVFETRGDSPSEFVYWPRRGTANANPPTLTIDACELAVGTSSNIGGYRMANDITWGWGEYLDGSGASQRKTVRVTAAASNDLFNESVQVNHDGPVLRESDANTIARWVLDTYDKPREDLSEVETIPLQKCDPDVVVDMLAADCGQLLTITNTPAAWISGGADWTGWIEGHELVGTPSDTRLTFKLTAKEK